MQLTLRRLVLFAVDVACTALTVMTGFQENPTLVALTGRYQLIRSRFEQGNINYKILRTDHLDQLMLVDLPTVGSTYRFVTMPTRTPVNLGEDRSTCMRVNSINTTVLAIKYDDFFGRGARRQQIFLHSISAPHCKVINFRDDWISSCVNGTFKGNAIDCHRYIFDQFDSLLVDRHIQAGASTDFGVIGRPFLKCLGRADKAFEYITDLLVLQSYWAGGSYHVEVQSSTCWAKPLVRDDSWQWGLFAVESADQSASVVAAVHQDSWVDFAIVHIFGVVAIVMILRGIFTALSLDNVVRYVPSITRIRRLPFVGLAVFVFPPKRKSDVVICRGVHFMASDLWMNHWLYIALSIADALVNIRLMYIVLGTGTWMLSKHQNLENFLFVCTAITRLTWVACFVHTVIRYSVKLAIRMLNVARMTTRPFVLEKLGWYVNACALFMSFKTYSIFLCAYLYALLNERGSTTLMVRQKAGKVAVFGGHPDLTDFWHSEIVCDLAATCCVLFASGLVVSSLLLLTKYRMVTQNRLMRLLQERYILVGWDAFTACEALGIEAFKDEFVRDGIAATNCSLASLLQQLYLSGPSGLVELAGDPIFSLYRSSSPSSLSQPSGQYEMLHVLRYPAHDAQCMGLLKCSSRQISPTEEKSDDDLVMTTTVTPHSISAPSSDVLEGAFAVSSKQTTKDKSLRVRRSTMARSKMASLRFESAPVCRLSDRFLRIHAESIWGVILLVDHKHAPGQMMRVGDTSTQEFVVQDALTFLKPDEMKGFLGTEQMLHIS